jgi:hypothetical protein
VAILLVGKFRRSHVILPNSGIRIVNWVISLISAFQVYCLSVFQLHVSNIVLLILTFMSFNYTKSEVNYLGNGNLS